jgi:hypothetical protein
MAFGLCALSVEPAAALTDILVRQKSWGFVPLLYMERKVKANI